MCGRNKSKASIHREATNAEIDNDRAAALGISVEEWKALTDSDRENLQAQIDAMRKMATMKARALERDRHYASVAGMTLEAWRGLEASLRKKKKAEIIVQEKAEREKERQKAANEKLKRDAAKPKQKKRSTTTVSAGLPGATRYSTIVGLMESPSDRKWNLFLREGPYWNFLVNYIQKRNIFRGRRDRVEEAVMNACEKIGKFMVSKRYKYQEEGKGYFRKAANHGYVEAQNMLGCLYYYGQEVERNFKEAVKWYRMAAEQGNAQAQDNLGVCYQYGCGVDSDLDEAAKWYNRAADSGHPQARDHLKALKAK